jgi:phospholipid-binding lipoprotein MlaA
LLLGAALLSGCATGPNANPADPLEPYNRSMSTFNENVDKAVLKPVATAYRDVTPQPLRTGVTNFFANLGDAWSFVNNVLQFKGREAFDSLVRLSVNTVFGLGGVLDVASEAGIDRHKQDFGLTLGHWGVPTGPYLVLPLLGPSTVRDASARVLDSKFGSTQLTFREPRDRNAALALGSVQTRVSLLNASRVLDEVALDKYTFLRDAYLARRRSQVYDGEPPEDKAPEDTPTAPDAPASGTK